MLSISRSIKYLLKKPARCFTMTGAILFDDPEHSYEEERFLIIGTTASSKICIVSHCYRGNDEIIRIISARKATKTEQNVYEKNL